MLVRLGGWRRLVLALALVLLATTSVATAARWPIESQPEVSGVVAAIPAGIDLSSETGAPAGKVRVMVELLEPSAAVAYAQALRAKRRNCPKRAAAGAREARPAPV